MKLLLDTHVFIWWASGTGKAFAKGSFPVRGFGKYTDTECRECLGDADQNTTGQTEDYFPSVGLDPKSAAKEQHRDFTH